MLLISSRNYIIRLAFVHLQSNGTSRSLNNFPHENASIFSLVVVSETLNRVKIVEWRIRPFQANHIAEWRITSLLSNYLQRVKQPVTIRSLLKLRKILIGHHYLKSWIREYHLPHSALISLTFSYQNLVVFYVLYTFFMSWLRSKWIYVEKYGYTSRNTIPGHKLITASKRAVWIEQGRVYL